MKKQLDDLKQNMRDAIPLFLTVSNISPVGLIKSKLFDAAVIATSVGVRLMSMKITFYNAGQVLAQFAINGLVNRVDNAIKSIGSTNAQWFVLNGERNVGDVVVVYHDADKAMKHLDIHLGSISLVCRVSGKPVEAQVKFNRDGILTEASKKALLSHLKSEIEHKSMFVQSTNHSGSEARSTWLTRSDSPVGYGHGNTRQVILDDKFELLDVRDKGVADLYLPSIIGDAVLYIYKIRDAISPVVIWGKLKQPLVDFKDRLELKLVDVEEFARKVDHSTVTRKYDGAAAYFATNSKHTDLYSPRISKRGGDHILYSMKAPEIYRATSSTEADGIGELLFTKDGQYLSAAQIGGILNSNKVRPLDTHLDYRVYRVDHWGGDNVSSTPFWKNRSLQSLVTRISKYIHIPTRSRIAYIKNWEGLVGTLKDSSINIGLKLKWWSEGHKWKVVQNNLSTNLVGHIVGSIAFKPDGSDKLYKLGPGQLGDNKSCMLLIGLGDKLIGSTAIVKSWMGFEGRGSKLVEWV